MAFDINDGSVDSIFNCGADNLTRIYRKTLDAGGSQSLDADDITLWDKIKTFIGYFNTQDDITIRNKYKDDFARVSIFDQYRMEKMKTDLNVVFQDNNLKDLSALNLEWEFVEETPEQLRKRSGRGAEANQVVLKDLSGLKFFTSELWSMWNNLNNILHRVTIEWRLLKRLFAERYTDEAILDIIKANADESQTNNVELDSPWMDLLDTTVRGIEKTKGRIASSNQKAKENRLGETESLTGEVTV